ncbi:uncharacterized protein LOC143178519 [Calliopsis andreniformis]|uniref:uncharacterized protein LOC143178519 n=1 Tax=Calliopsis andreniformis TaxID=337506 RepID=UPI003FCC5E87
MKSRWQIPEKNQPNGRCIHLFRERERFSPSDSPASRMMAIKLTVSRSGFFLDLLKITAPLRSSVSRVLRFAKKQSKVRVQVDSSERKMPFVVPSFLWALSVSALAVSIAAQDAKTVLFPAPGNGSLESVGRFEPALPPEMTRPPEPLARPFTLPANQYLPANNFIAPQRTFVHHRSDSLPPYVYEHPGFGYPVAHSIDHSVGPSSKQLVIVSFIGLLLLFAIIQNTIAAVKRRDIGSDVLSAREKRDIYASYDFNSVTPEQEDVLNEDARVRCIQKTVCLENRKLLKAFGAAGKILAKHLTQSVTKSLKSSGWDRLVQDAGEAGIRDEDCDVLYRDCEELKDRGEAKAS